MADPTTCPHGVTQGMRCFACNSADTLPLTMPDQLSRELAAARAKLAALEVLAKLRAHPGFGELCRVLRDTSRLYMNGAQHGDDEAFDDYLRMAEVYTLLLELLGGPHG